MNKKHQVAIGILVGLCLIGLLYFSITAQKKLLRSKELIDKDSPMRLVMGTFAHIIAVAPDSNTANKCIETAFEKIGEIEELASFHSTTSEIAQINRSAYEAPVKVSESIFEVLQKAVEFSELSNGAFDITVGPLVELWRLSREANSVPSDNELADARSRVGYKKLILDANQLSVQFAAEGMKVDLGGIAKGYAIDKAVEAMQNCGAAGGMVDIGGDIRCFGIGPKGRENWRIGLEDPKKADEGIGTGELLAVLKLTNIAVATSGDYRRFALIEGKKYSHIIDTKTGSGSNELSSVTIFAKSAADADALATAVSVMGPEKGLALIETIPETEAILIPSPPNSERIQTSGAEKYIK